ncbi:MAG TPA: aminotransferase class I/II-fold pyridoxal phosphate-dependent enzyme [Chloroflexota bacterium]|nr:aminotransferase class I/II-fold pyridoxal phosphate-dependent enzyme [Chloroflexota bacterium]
MSAERADAAVAVRPRLARRVAELAPSGIRRFFDLISTLDGVISLGVGEPDFVTPWHIREAAIHSLERGYTMYTSNQGLIELRRAVARHLERLYRVSYDPAGEILITVGVSEGLDLALRALIDPGDEVLIPEPSYVSYGPCTQLAGGRPVYVPARRERDFRVDPAEVAKRVGPRTRAILIGYPNNPTGAVMPRRELEKIARLAAERDLVVLSDEIYDRLVYGVEHTCFASLPGARERTVLLGGFSKAYAMTGWRIGYLAAPSELIDGMVKIHQYAALCAPIPSQKAALEALERGEEAVRSMVEEYDGRRRLIVHGLNRLGLCTFEPRGAFYCFPSIASTGLSSEQFAERLLLEGRVAVVPGNAFGPSGEGHVRCCYATSTAGISEALERIGRFLGGLG